MAVHEGAYKMIVYSRPRNENFESLFEMTFEAKGVTKTRPRQRFGIIVGACLGLASVEESSKVFGLELKMDINSSRLELE